MAQDYYELLGVEKDASHQDIKRAFRTVARECHPDVAGDDPVLHERFKACRKAYETLMDPVTRARYDRRNEQRGPRGGSFFDAFYNHVSGNFGDQPKAAAPKTRPRPSYGAHDAGGHASSRGASGGRNDLDLDDLFSDFGGTGRRRSTSSARGTARPSSAPSPVPGDDVHIEVDVPAAVARAGGTVTAVYYRAQRMDSWRPGSPSPGVARVQDIADIRILPGTRDGETLRELGRGDAGPWGGPEGALVVRLRVLPEVVPEEPEPALPPEPEPEDEPPPVVDEVAADGAPEAATPVEPLPVEASEEQVLDLHVAEAILGTQVALDTAGGRVRLNIPPGTSGGARLRLRGKAADGGDLYLRVRIVVPKGLDDESLELIRRFAELNPPEGSTAPPTGPR